MPGRARLSVPRRSRPRSAPPATSASISSSRRRGPAPRASVFVPRRRAAARARSPRWRCAFSSRPPARASSIELASIGRDGLATLLAESGAPAHAGPLDGDTLPGLLEDALGFRDRRLAAERHRSRPRPRPRTRTSRPVPDSARCGVASTSSGSATPSRQTSWSRSASASTPWRRSARTSIPRSGTRASSSAGSKSS